MLRTSLVVTLFSCMWLLACIQPTVQAEPTGRTNSESASLAADSLLLDQYPDTRTGYSLGRLSSSYSGPIVKVRRMTDNAEQDFGLDGDKLDVSALESWLGSADGKVVRWYAQDSSMPDLVSGENSRFPNWADGIDKPYIARSGTVTRDQDGRIALKFENNAMLSTESAFTSIQLENSLAYAVIDRGPVTNPRRAIFNLCSLTEDWYSHMLYQVNRMDGQDRALSIRDEVSSQTQWTPPNEAGWYAVNYSDNKEAWVNNAKYDDAGIGGSLTVDDLTIGVRAGSIDNGWTGYISEVGVLPSQSSGTDVQNVYDVSNALWNVGPTNYDKDALLPQLEQWHVDLYNWMKTVSESDVTLSPSPSNATITYDDSHSTLDELADRWLKVKALSASRVTRNDPGWYVLDNGNGKGIEATGVVRANHEPESGYPGNDARSYENEPAYWYDLKIELSDGSAGNPWYGEPAMARRAMMVACADMMMYSANLDGSGTSWFDHVGMSALGYAQAYAMAGDVMPPDVQDAFESGMARMLDWLLSQNPRGVNTNRDMWGIEAAAQMWAASSSSTVKSKAVDVVKKALFGDPNASLEGPNHKVHIPSEPRGYFDPGGFIVEGGQPEVNYGGGSLTHISGALHRVMDRTDGSVPPEWSFLETVVERMQDWRTYQFFHDSYKINKYGSWAAVVPTSGTGFSSRTSYGVPVGTETYDWSRVSIADFKDDYAWRVTKHNRGMPTQSEMQNEIDGAISDMNSKMSSYANSQPPQWTGWSPWTKRLPYLPEEGWYSRLKTLYDNDDPKAEKPPAARSGNTWNKTFGGGNAGNSFWSYVGTDTNGQRFGFYVEAMPQQGYYDGWYGGKVETFWTEETGVILINRHGKSGCSRTGVDDYSNFEDSACWFNLDRKAGHHVWGRDENDNGFTTLLLRGRELQRTATYDIQGSPPSVTVNNVFNDPSLSQGSSNTGEQTGSELEGSVEVENKFEVQSNGLKVTHSLTSDQTDDVNELWASLPVYLRHYNPHRAGDDAQGQMSDTKIEYWDGSQWAELPYDTDNDGVPEFATTGVLRLERDYSAAGGPVGHVYINFATDQTVRRSKGKYYDPYQTKTGVRTVNVDLHGNPGTTKTLPASKSVSYTIQTTDPTSEGNTTGQVIPLQKGWNIASTSVSPTSSAMDSVFAGLQSEIAVVKNEAGERYRPSEDINEIGQWNSEEAYAVHAKSDVTLSVVGDSLGSPSIALEQGWNWVPYFPASSLSVEEAVSSIVEDLGLLKDESGRVYLPGKDPDVLVQMEPGEGYKVYVRQSTTLTYPEGGN